MLKNSSILITGGTGSFGSLFIPLTLKKFKPLRVVSLVVDGFKLKIIVVYLLFKIIHFIFFPPLTISDEVYSR